jgi:nucleotide-binding universal stress UspA family protein
MIVGIKRHGTIEKFLVGSTTEAVIRHSTCPVLVVHPTIASSK